jgi:hypothetical protein
VPRSNFVILLSGAAVVMITSLSACTPRDGDEPAEAEEQEVIGSGSVLAAARSPACSTNVVRGLSEQLVEELACLHRTPFARIDSVPNLQLTPEVLPFLQKPVADSLKSAAAAYGRPMRVTSALRTVAQQFVLADWASRHVCNVYDAAKVGNSGHEEGLAVDVSMRATAAANRAVRANLVRKGFVWQGAGDRVHFTYDAAGDDLKGLSILAFQRLWNRNNPSAPIPETGIYADGVTPSKLERAPAAGFPIGATCSHDNAMTTLQ